MATGAVILKDAICGCNESELSAPLLAGTIRCTGCKVECCDVNICRRYPIAITIDVIWTLLAFTLAAIANSGKSSLPSSSSDYFMPLAVTPLLTGTGSAVFYFVVWLIKRICCNQSS